MGAAAAHHADVARHGDRLEAEPSEDALVGLVVQLVAVVQPGLVGIAAVAVLHDELADADQPAAGARLVAELGLEVVDDQRQLTVALDDVAQQVGHDLLVGHGQHHVASRRGP